MDDQEIEVLKSEPWTRVTKIPDDGRVVVEKTYFYPPYLSWRTILQPSRAEREACGLRAAEAAGVPCLRVVRVGGKRRLGCVLSSSITTLFEADTTPLRDYLLHPPATSYPGGWVRLRRQLGIAMAGLVHDLHQAGILWLTVTPRNFLVKGPPEDIHLLVSDMPKAICLPESMLRTPAAGVDLYDLCFAPQRRLLFTSRDRLAMLIRYCDGDRPSARKLWRRLCRRNRFGNTLRRRLLTALTRVGLVPTVHMLQARR
jgi:hypothetical protein